jgi:hypothetical protein
MKSSAWIGAFVVIALLNASPAIREVLFPRPIQSLAILQMRHP